MSSSEKLCLKWNDYQENIGSSYKELREAQEFSDVTLACEDNHKILAHQVILASASNFFKTIFIENRHSHPLIYMRGVKARDLTSVVDFIYHGEANINEGDLNDFLAIAEELHLKGLSGSNTSNTKPSPLKETINNSKKKKFSNHLVDSFTLPNLLNPGTSDTDTNMLTPSFDNTVSLFEVSPIFEAKTSVSFKNENSELDKNINTMLQKVNDLWTCIVCGKTDKNNRSDNVRKHIETHIEGLAHPCGHCGKTFRSRNSLQLHISRYHKTQ